MCGRFTLHLSPELPGTVFGVKTPLQLPPRYNIAPSQKQTYRVSSNLDTKQ